MKTGLILEGGAMRGMFTAGVLDVLMEQGITVDGMVGVSAGAVFGCNYKSHQIGRTIRYNTTYCKDKRYASFRNLLRTGNLYSEDFCYHEVPEKLDPFDDKAFRESPMDYFVVCTDVRTGDPIYHKCRFQQLVQCFAFDGLVGEFPAAAPGENGIQSVHRSVPPVLICPSIAQ